MGIVTEPKVTVIGYSKFVGHPDYHIPEDGNNFERGLTFATKGCYRSWGKDKRACLENQRAVLEHGHGSVLEHGVINLYIEGISRSLSLELNRHRHLAISQASTRYIAEEDANQVLDPYYTYLYEKYKDKIIEAPLTGHKGNYLKIKADGLGTLPERILLSHALNKFREDVMSYRSQVDTLMSLNPLDLEGFDLRKWARGKARQRLPHDLETSGTWSGNIRAWRHIIETRSSIHAEEEIRRLAFYIYGAVKRVAPVYFEDYELHYKEVDIEGYEQYPEIRTEHRKV